MLLSDGTLSFCPRVKDISGRVALYKQSYGEVIERLSFLGL